MRAISWNGVGRKRVGQRKYCTLGNIIERKIVYFKENNEYLFKII